MTSSGGEQHSSTVEQVEKLRLDLQTTERELVKQKQTFEIEKTTWDHDRANMNSQIVSLQASIDALSNHRQRETKDRSESAKGMEGLRAENSKMRREVAGLLDTKLSHLRTPQVSFEQYRELLLLCERYATALTIMNGGEPTATTTQADAEALKGANEWVKGMCGSGGSLGGVPVASGVRQVMMPHLESPTTTKDSQEQQHQRQQLLLSENASSVAGPPSGPAIAVSAPHGLHLDLARVTSTSGGGGHSTVNSMHSQQLSNGGDGFLPGLHNNNTRQLAPQHYHDAIGSSSEAGGGGGSAAVAGLGSSQQLEQQRFQGATHGNGGAAGGDNRPIRESVVEGGKLVKIIRDAAPNIGKHWSFHNTTTDTQFIVEFTFGPMCDITSIGAEKEGRMYRLSLFPGETKSFVRGLINGYKMAVKYGPPDSSFVPPSAMTDGDLSPQVDRAREVLEAAAASGEGGGFGGGEDLGSPAQQLGYLLEDGLPFIDIAFPPLSSCISVQGSAGKEEGRSTIPPLKLLLPTSYLQTGQRSEVLGSAVIGPGEICSGHFTTANYCGALRAVAESKDLVLSMFQHGSPEESSSGLHYVWINKRGLWESVALDAYIPCDPKDDLPYGIHSYSRKALWPSLVEKGLAKLQGSYSALQALSAATKEGLEALQDLTGFPTERLDWKTKETTLFNQVHKFVGATSGNIVVLFTPRGGIVEGSELSLEARRTESIGLELNSMNRVIATVNAEGFRLCLIRVPTQRNLAASSSSSSSTTTAAAAAATTNNATTPPGGDSGLKWAGAWSEGSEMWNRHPLVRESCEQAKAPVPHTTTTSGEDSGTEVIWMDWRDVGIYFEGAGVCYARPSWVDYRLPTRFTGTKPSCMVELQVLKMTSVYIGVHQGQKQLNATPPAGSDNQLYSNNNSSGSPSGASPGGIGSNGGPGGSSSGEGKYSAFLITVVGCSPNGVWDTVGQSRGGSFWRGRDVHLALTLRPSDHSYYVLVQRFSADGIKDVTISVHAEHREAVNLSMRQPTDAVMTAVQYSPVWKFDPSPCPVIPAFPGQLDRVRTNFPLTQAQLAMLQHRQQLQHAGSVAGRQSGHHHGGLSSGGEGRTFNGANFGHHRVATNMSMGSDAGTGGGHNYSVHQDPSFSGFVAQRTESRTFRD